MSLSSCRRMIHQNRVEVTVEATMMEVIRWSHCLMSLQTSHLNYRLNCLSTCHQKLWNL